MNCGRPIVAGRFAPHLEKCMGKGRNTRLKSTRNNTSLQQRRARTNPIPLYNTSLSSGGTFNANRTLNRTSVTNVEDFQKTAADFTEGTS